MGKRYKLADGSFYEGFGVCILDVDTNKFFHKMVFEESETKKLYINMGTRFDPIRIHEEEIEISNKKVDRIIKLSAVRLRSELLLL